MVVSLSLSLPLALSLSLSCTSIGMYLYTFLVEDRPFFTLSLLFDLVMHREPI